jgi:predicted nucleotidyltransferase
MRNEEIPQIKEIILETLGDDCEKIILFGSYAYGTPKEESDIDIYVVLKDGSKLPVLALEDIYVAFGKQKEYEPVDVLANYKSRFESLSTAGLTMEQKIAKKGVVIYG